MPLTPATWLADFTVNLTTANSQSNPRVTHLANGNILIVWDSNDNTGVGVPGGTDVLGQLFNPLGERIGGEFRVNFKDTQDEEDADIAALPGGGFITVNGSSGINFRDIYVTVRDASGGNPVEARLEFDVDSNGDNLPDFVSPRVAVSSATSALVVCEQIEINNETRIIGRVYNPEANTFGSQISVINFVGKNKTPSVTVLENGNYVIAAETLETGGNSTITLRILSATGSNVLGATRVAATTGNGISESTPSVTALDGGGFVLAWHEATSASSQSAKFQIFSDAGVAQGTAVTVASNDPDGADTFEPAVVALDDGGFLVLYEDQQFNDLEGQRYDASGNAVGATFAIAGTATSAGDIDAELLADGRVVVTYTKSDFEVGMQILDTRDAANDPGVYTPEDWQIGTIGDDTITSDGDVFFVAGHDGDDTLITGGFAATYLGGNGNDLVQVTSLIDNDAHDGGADNDTIDWSNSGQIGGIFNLVAGIASDASDPGNVLIEVMSNFENLVGTVGVDNITGTDGANNLFGGFGEDMIAGGGGDDFLDGGGDNDEITGGGGFDDLFGEGGEDRLFGGDQDDGLSGGAGNDTLSGGAGADTLFGNGEDDTLSGGEGDDTLVGGDGRDTLSGGSGVDQLVGGNDDDTFLTDDDGFFDESFGGAGNDRFVLNNSFFAGDFDGGADLGDVIDASNYVDFSIIINLGAGTYEDSGSVFTLTNVENAIGSQLADTITGSDGDNILEGQGGGDTLTGSGGNDTVLGGSGNDRLNGGAGTDTMLGGANNDTYTVDVAGDQVFETTTTTSGIDAGGIDTVQSGVTFNLDANAGVRFVERLTLTGADNINATGNALANILTGNSGNNTLNGGIGSDKMLGQAGSDTYVVNVAGDRVFETTTLTSTIDAGGIDRVQSSVTLSLDAYNGVRFVERLTLTGTDNINGSGNGLANLLTGNIGKNVLNGAGGNDTLVGGAGIDSFVFNTALGAGNIDRISDFSVVDDRIRLDDAIFTQLLAGTLDANAFVANSAGVAATEDQRILYNTANGRLYYDSDGAGGVARIQFATLTAGLALTSEDFFVL